MNIHVGATEKDGEVIFLHKMMQGPADKSYGIHVGKLAGLPESLIERADQILTKLENQEEKQVAQVVSQSKEEAINVAATVKENPSTPAVEQLSLFSEMTPAEEKVLAAIKSMDLANLKPMDVFFTINELKRELEKE